MQQNGSISEGRQVGQLDIEFTSKPMTPWGGISVLVGKFFERIGFRQWAESSFPVQETSPNGGGVYEKILAQFLTMLCGGDRFAHSGWWDHSRVVFCQAFGLGWLPAASSTLTRFWGKISSQGLCERWMEHLRGFALTMVREAGIVEDSLLLDSTVATRYGDQEGAHRGYNPTKPGRKSHHPLLAALGSGYVVNLWNRSGDSSSGNFAVDFLKQTMVLLAGHVHFTRILADSGFYLVELLEFIERRAITYIVAVRQEQIIQKQLEKLLLKGVWEQIEPGLAVGEFYFKHLDAKWKHARRYVVVRQDKKLRPNATGKQPSLFEDLPNFSHYRFSIMVTNDEQTPAYQIWKQYRERAKVENTIKEIKDGYGLANFSTKNFWSTWAVMGTNALVFFNLIHYLNKHVLSPTGPLPQLKSLRARWFAIPATLGRNSRRSILRVGLPEGKSRDQMLKHFDQIGAMNFQLQSS